MTMIRFSVCCVSMARAFRPYPCWILINSIRARVRPSAQLACHPTPWKHSIATIWVSSKSETIGGGEEHPFGNFQNDMRNAKWVSWVDRFVATGSPMAGLDKPLVSCRAPLPIFQHYHLADICTRLLKCKWHSSTSVISFPLLPSHCQTIVYIYIFHLIYVFSDRLSVSHCSNLLLINSSIAPDMSTRTPLYFEFRNRTIYMGL